LEFILSIGRQAESQHNAQLVEQLLHLRWRHLKTVSACVSHSILRVQLANEGSRLRKPRLFQSLIGSLNYALKLLWRNKPLVLALNPEPANLVPNQQEVFLAFCQSPPSNVQLSVEGFVENRVFFRLQ
jgi:hypothetical protein